MKVRTLAHPSLNSSKGVIRCPDLSDVSEEEILRELRPQEVSGVRRISFLKNGRRVPTNTLVLTFSTPILPKTIKVGYLYVKIAVYIPNPLRCFQCQKFGHHETRCESEEFTCGNCSSTSHPQGRNEQCNNPSKCVNCNGSHETRSKDCPVWKKEKEILKTKYTQNITFPEARKIVTEKYKIINEKSTYSAVIKSSSHTSVVLVDSWTQDEKDDQPSGKTITPTKYKKTSDSTPTDKSNTSTSATNKSETKRSVSKETPTSSVNRRRAPTPESPTRNSRQSPETSRSRGRSRRPTVDAVVTPATRNRFDCLMDTGGPPDNRPERTRSPIHPPK